MPDNFSGNLIRVKSGKIVENGAGTYNFDVFIPAGAIILDVLVHNEVLWAAGTSASLVAGDYASSNVDGSPTIGSAIDADGFIAATNVKATDLVAGESINFAWAGGKNGAYVDKIEQDEGASPPDGNVHVRERVSLVDRFIRFTITSVGAGTTGTTFCAVVYARPTEVATVTQ